jgi:hypothetical protein
MLRLNESQTRALLTQPETGMGYQEVEVTHKDNKAEKGIVYNAELLFEGNETQTVLKLSVGFQKEGTLAFQNLSPLTCPVV